MKNLKDLRRELELVFNGVKNGSIDVQSAKSLVATSNAILKTVQLELDRNKMTGELTAIDWLGEEEIKRGEIVHPKPLNEKE